jgi:hypothetical protein
MEIRVSDYMNGLIPMIPIILFVIGIIIFKKCEWRRIRHVVVLIAFYSILCFGLFALICGLVIKNSYVIKVGLIPSIGASIILPILIIIDKLLIKKTRETKVELKKSNIIYTQGRVVKAVKEGTVYNSYPLVSYYYLVLEYEHDGKKEYCKTKRSYTLNAVAYILKRYPMVGIEVRDGYCRLPSIPKEAMTEKYDQTILEGIKFENKEKGVVSESKMSLRALPLVIIIPAFFASYFMYWAGNINLAFIVSGILSVLMTIVAAWWSRGV